MFCKTIYQRRYQRHAHTQRVKQTLNQARNFKTVPPSCSKVPPGAGIRILSIDGGGSRGLVAATLMKGLEDSIRRQTGNDKAHLADYFDLVCGVSTGGLIALAHAFKRYKLEDIQKIYLSGIVFDTPYSWWYKYWSLLSSGSMYNPENFDRLLKVIFSAKDRLPKPECRPAVFVVTKPVAKQIPILASTYPLPPSSAIPHGTNKWSVAEACRATSAAPVYLPAIRIGTTEYVDGSLACGNDPTSIGIDEAEKLFQGREIDLIVSVGTGLTLPGDSYFPPLTEIRDSIAQPEPTHYTMQKRYGIRFQSLNIRVENANLDESRRDVLKNIQNKAELEVTGHQTQYDEIAQILSGQKSPSRVTDWNWIDVGGYSTCAKSALETGLQRNLGRVNLKPVTTGAVLASCERLSTHRPWRTWKKNLNKLKTTLQDYPGDFIISSRSPLSAAVVIGFCLQKGSSTVIFCDQKNPYLVVNDRNFPVPQEINFEITSWFKELESPRCNTVPYGTIPAVKPAVFLFLCFGKNSNPELRQVTDLCSQNNLALVRFYNARISVPEFQYKPGLEAEMAEQLEILHKNLAKGLTELSSTHLLFATDAPWAVAMLFGVVFNSNKYPACTYLLLEQVHGSYQLAFTIP